MRDFIWLGMVLVLVALAPTCSSRAELVTAPFPDPALYMDVETREDYSQFFCLNLTTDPGGQTCSVVVFDQSGVRERAQLSRAAGHRMENEIDSALECTNTTHAREVSPRLAYSIVTPRHSVELQPCWDTLPIRPETIDFLLYLRRSEAGRMLARWGYRDPLKRPEVCGGELQFIGRLRVSPPSGASPGP